MPYKKILALDVAKRTGWAFLFDNEIEESGTITNATPEQYYEDICELLDKWKPTYIIAASPSRFFNTIFQHGKLFGMIELALKKRGLEFYMEKTAKGRMALPMDSHIKKVVIGKGKVSKEEIKCHFKCQDEDEADARMFATYLNIQLT